MDVSSSVFWYAYRVFPWYYLISISLILCAMKIRNDFIRLLLMYLMVAMILLPPHVLIKTFIVFDTYPYAADVYYVILRGRIANIHRLGTTPGYALTYATYCLLSGIPLYNLVKAFPLVILLTLPALLMSIVDNEHNKYKLVKALAIVMPFVFFINQPLNFHRATLFLPYILLILLLLKLYLKGCKHISILTPLVFISASSTYSMTLILTAFLATSLLLKFIFKIILCKTHSCSQPYHAKFLWLFILLAFTGVLIYYLFFSSGGYLVSRDLSYIICNVVHDLKQLLFTPPTEIVHQVTPPTKIIHQGAYMAKGVTPEFAFAVKLRLYTLAVLTLMTLSVCSLYILHILKKSLLKHDIFHRCLISLWIVILLTLAITSFILQYKGFIVKFHFMYTLISCVTLLTLLNHLHIYVKFRYNIFNIIIFIILLTQLLITPLTSFIALPVIHPPVVEEEGFRYVVKYYQREYVNPEYNKLLYVEYSAPWNIDLLVYGVDFISISSIPYHVLIDRIELMNVKYPILLTSRFLLRDDYILKMPTHEAMLKEALHILYSSRNLVYNTHTSGHREEFTLVFSKAC